MISAGEASSDMHAAHALSALKNQGLEFDCFGMGADKLEAVGMELTLDCRELAVIGIVDVLINYPTFLKRLKLLRETMRQRKPDLLIIVDYPDFNLKLAETAKALGIPVLFYISPQIWAWRKKRINRIGELVDHMAVLFPFEVDVYEQANIPVRYVGHPLVDDAHSPFDKAQARAHLGLSSSVFVSLQPGSRNGELSRNLPLMLQSAKLLQQKHPSIEFAIPVAPTLDRQQVAQLVNDSHLDVAIIDGQSYNVMRAADAVLTASGTATLETAMLGTPMAVMYVINTINYALMKRLIQIDNIGLVNIVAGRRICQEFVQSDAEPQAMADELEQLLFNANYRREMQINLRDVREKMGTGGASGRVAQLIRDMLFDV
jgi:lipid-A-disaccharide synthase